MNMKTVKLKSEIAEKLKLAALLEGVSQQDLLESIVIEYLKKRSQKDREQRELL